MSEERAQQHESGGEFADKCKRTSTSKANPNPNPNAKANSNNKSKKKPKKKSSSSSLAAAAANEESSDSHSGSDGSGVGYERQREHPFVVTEPGEVARAKKNGLDYLFHLYEQCREFLMQVQALAKERGDKCPAKVTLTNV